AIHRFIVEDNKGRAGEHSLPGKMEELKEQTKRELDVPLGTSVRAGDLAELWVAQRGIRTAPLRRIRNVVGLSAELELDALGDRERLEHREIDLPLSGKIVALQAQGAGRSGRREGHSRGIKPLLRRTASRGRILGIFPRDQIGTAVIEVADAVLGSQSERLPCPERGDPVHLPVAEQRIGHAIPGGTILLTLAEWQIVVEGPNHTVANIPRGA